MQLYVSASVSVYRHVSPLSLATPPSAPPTGEDSIHSQPSAAAAAGQPPAADATGMSPGHYRNTAFSRWPRLPPTITFHYTMILRQPLPRICTETILCWHVVTPVRRIRPLSASRLHAARRYVQMRAAPCRQQRRRADTATPPPPERQLTAEPQAAGAIRCAFHTPPAVMRGSRPAREPITRRRAAASAAASRASRQMDMIKHAAANVSPRV